MARLSVKARLLVFVVCDWGATSAGRRRLHLEEVVVEVVLEEPNILGLAANRRLIGVCFGADEGLGLAGPER